MLSFGFHPVIATWFEEKYGAPTNPQQLGWPAIRSRAHTLIAAPTGSGKTLAAFFAELNQLFQDGLEGQLEPVTRVLYVSPLKALSNDIHKNLEEPLNGIRQALFASAGVDVNVVAQVRTGDTPAQRRQAMLRKPPHILVTTPESFYLLLTSESGRGMLRAVRTVIVDEIHAVVGNRRGSHLALSLERLAKLVENPLQRIGLSATQKPIEDVAAFLVGNTGLKVAGQTAECRIIDAGHRRHLDLAIEVPGSPLEAVMSNEVWSEVYLRLARLIEEHQTTLVFVNTRRLAERVTHHLAERLGSDKVMSHHGSLSAKLRLDAEDRLKRGELKALVATASLELGIDIGSVDLVCQIGPTRSIATLLQRVGRAGHRQGGVSKGRVFPLTRDELIECVATVESVRRGELDAVRIPKQPLDVLAQQMVACAAERDWGEDELYSLVRSAYPYRDLPREHFLQVLSMLAEGFSTRRGRRAALLHHDAVNHRIRGRRGSRLIALTSGGAIPDNSDFRVVVDPGDTFIGTVNEDFAVESMAGDIFQLGSTSWRILSINAGTVRVQDAQGQPPGIPFWLGEAPGRTAEVSQAVSDFCRRAENVLRQSCPGDDASDALTGRLGEIEGMPQAAAKQLAEYLKSSYQSLGALPSQNKLIIERFFDESGGMQLVIHSRFGIGINRAWGLALRKRFCRSFNFELQAAATDDAIVLSLGTQHSFPLEEVFRYLHSNTVRDLLVQALLDSPMFAIRWRWNATRALALPRQRAGRKIPAPIQRMESENLLAAVFPDQLACLENIAGDREVPDHPLVRQTIEDCLTEAMDLKGLVAVLRGIEDGRIECVARDLPQPSPLAHEILNARPYAFLDNAPLEERRTRAVYTRRSSELSSTDELGILDPAAIETVAREAWPRATNPDELHDALLLAGVLATDELNRIDPGAPGWLNSLVEQRRAGRLIDPHAYWVAAERLALVRAVYGTALTDPILHPPDSEQGSVWEREQALRELVRGRMEITGPITVGHLAAALKLPESDIETGLMALESEGFVLRGKFNPGACEIEWCDRRLLARIHRLTINRLRAEIQPVSIAVFQRYLTFWQRVSPEHQLEGADGVLAAISALDAFEIAAGAWEPAVLAIRVKGYHPRWLDHYCATGRVGWGRLTPPQTQSAKPFAPIRSSPISVFLRENLVHWLALSPGVSSLDFSPDTIEVFELFQHRGALFFTELLKRRSLMPSRVEQALAELSAHGLLTADTFEGLRALLVPAEKRVSFAETSHRRRHKTVSNIEFAGRWALLRDGQGSNDDSSREAAVEAYARALLRRYGVVFRRLLEQESLKAAWYEMIRVFRRLEARGEIRGGYFVAGVGGEQFALPEAVGLLRSTRKLPMKAERIVISGSDPLNLTGILIPGKRISALASNRILLRDGTPIAALEGREIVALDPDAGESGDLIERSLRIGSMPASLRPYYAR